MSNFASFYPLASPKKCTQSQGWVLAWTSSRFPLLLSQTRCVSGGLAAAERLGDDRNQQPCWALSIYTAVDLSSSRNRTAEIARRDKPLIRLESPLIRPVSSSASNDPNRQNPAESRVFPGESMGRGEQSLLKPPQWRWGSRERTRLWGGSLLSREIVAAKSASKL